MYEKPEMEIVRVNVLHHLLGGSVAADVNRTVTSEENTENNNVFGATEGADVSEWGN